MPPAVIPIAAAGIAAAGSIGGAIMGGNAQKKAAGKAADTQQAATAAQLELGNKSLALQEQMFNQGLDFNKMQAGVSYDVLSPFVGNGLGASNALTALLGVSPAQMPANPYTLAAAPTAPPASGGTMPAGGNALGPASVGPQPTGAGLAGYIQNRF